MISKITNEIPIFFTIDDAYAPFLAAALNSAIKNSNPTRRYRAFVLHQGLTKENEIKLKSLERDNFRVTISPIDRSLSIIDDRQGNRLRCDYFTLTIYFRLFIPTLFPEYDKGIYIDSDVVLTDDIAKLFDEDLGDNLIGACRDSSITDIPPFVNYTEEAIGVNFSDYINSGVLLLNMKKLREEGFEEHFLNLLNTYHFDSVAPDQDYINAICNGRIHYLDPKWDFMPNDAKPIMENPSLVHYNLFSKPWCYDNIQHGDKFWHYAQDCGYIDELRSIRASFNEDKVKEEKACLENMLSRAVEIPKGDVTLRKIKESGVKIRL